MAATKFRNDRMPPIEVLRARVEYCPESGTLAWGRPGPETFVSAHAWKVWTAKFAGKPILKRNRGYAVVTISYDGRTFYCEGHRVAWALMHGAWPEHEVDHIDRDPGNNAWANLRAADHQENQWNKARGARNQSGFKGVHRHTQNGYWIAQITTNGKARHLGCFASPELASQAYQAASAAAFGAYHPGAQ